MPTIVLDQPVSIPVRELEGGLTRVVPPFKWRVGDEIDAAVLTLDRPVTIMGLAGPEVVMLVIELRRQPLPLEAGAPPHAMYLHLGGPSTDEAETAKRIVVVTAAHLLAGTNGFAQIAPDGPWYSATELSAGLKRLLDDPVRTSVDEFLVSHGQRHPSAAPSASPAERPTMSDLDPSVAMKPTEVDIPSSEPPRPDIPPTRPAGLLGRDPKLFGRRPS